MNRLCFVVASLALALSAAPARADVSAREIIAMLQDSIEMKDWQAPMTFRECAGLFQEKLQAKGKDLQILVDEAAFRANDALDVYETQVKFAPYPRSMPAIALLRIVLAQFPVPATYLIRQGHIEIVPASHATLKHLLQQKVTADFDRKGYADAIHDLAEMTGVSIQLDARLTKELPALTATFRNDIALRDVLHVLAERAGAHVKELPTGVVIAPGAAPVKQPAGPKRQTTSSAEGEPGSQLARA